MFYECVSANEMAVTRTLPYNDGREGGTSGHQGVLGPWEAAGKDATRIRCVGRT